MQNANHLLPCGSTSPPSASKFSFLVHEGDRGKIKESIFFIYMSNIKQRVIPLELARKKPQTPSNFMHGRLTRVSRSLLLDLKGYIIN